MNDHAYDVSYLEAELTAACAPPARVEKAPPAVSLHAAVAAAQEAMARELMLAAEVHEDLIRQYLGISGDMVTGGVMH